MPPAATDSGGLTRFVAPPPYVSPTADSVEHRDDHEMVCIRTADCQAEHAKPVEHRLSGVGRVVCGEVLIEGPQLAPGRMQLRERVGVASMLGADNQQRQLLLARDALHD